jgi:hypothetical protein
MLFTEQQLNSMRAALVKTMDSTASRMVKQTVSDNRGGREVTWVADLEFPCRLNTKPPRTAQIESEAKMISDPEFHMIYPYDVRIQSYQRVTINGQVFEIIAVFHDPTTNLHGRANLRKVD